MSTPTRVGNALLGILLALAAPETTGTSAWATGHPVGAMAQEADESPPSLRIDNERSYLVAVTTRAGVLGFLGHEHGVLSPEWTAEVRYDPADPASARASLSVAVPKLLIDTEAARRRARLAAAGPSDDELVEIHDRMLGPDQLDAAAHPRLSFVSEVVEPLDPARLRVQGQLTLHGVTRAVETVMTVRRVEEFLLFHGELSIRQTDFGITPVSIGGVVKVGDEVQIRYAIWAIAEP